jgi:hypothetical protein
MSSPHHLSVSPRKPGALPNTVRFGGRSFSSALHWQSVESTQITAFSTSRPSPLHGLSPCFAGRISGATSALSSLIQTAKLNGVDPRAWLADVLTRIADMPQQRLHELLPWNWKKQQNMAFGTA